MQAIRTTPDTLDMVPSRVLIVDDEVLIRFVATDILHDAGYTVVEASTADEAIDLLAADARFDVIVTDIRMPGAVDGLGLLAHVRQCHPAIRVVLTSGHLTPYDLGLTGADAVIGKPYAAATLVEAVERVLGGTVD